MKKGNDLRNRGGSQYEGLPLNPNQFGVTPPHRTHLPTSTSYSVQQPPSASLRPQEVTERRRDVREMEWGGDVPPNSSSRSLATSLRRSLIPSCPSESEEMLPSPPHDVDQMLEEEEEEERMNSVDSDHSSDWDPIFSMELVSLSDSQSKAKAKMSTQSQSQSRGNSQRYWCVQFECDFLRFFFEFLRFFHSYFSFHLFPLPFSPLSLLCVLWYSLSSFFHSWKWHVGEIVKREREKLSLKRIVFYRRIKIYFQFYFANDVSIFGKQILQSENKEFIES